MIVYTHIHSVHRVIRDYAKVHFAIKYLRYLSSQFAGMVCTIVAIVLTFSCMTLIIAFRTFQDTQPGNSDSCITFVQTILPIALARPYVEQYVPEGTRVRLTLYMSIYITVTRELKRVCV